MDFGYYNIDCMEGHDMIGQISLLIVLLIGWGLAIEAIIHMNK